MAVPIMTAPCSRPKTPVCSFLSVTWETAIFKINLASRLSARMRRPGERAEAQSLQIALWTTDDANQLRCLYEDHAIAASHRYSDSLTGNAEGESK